MPVRIPVPVISFGALAVLLGLGLGVALGGAEEQPTGGLGGQGVRAGTGPAHPQDEVDGPPMDYQAAESSAARAAKSAAPTTRSSAKTEEPSAAPVAPTAETTRPPEVIVLSSAPVLPTLPSVSQQPPSSSTPSPTAPSEIAR